jgi:pyrrolidone-carboxylate peptidase
VCPRNNRNNHQSTDGEQSYTFGTGHTDAIITIPTNSGSTGGTFSLQVGDLYDYDAAAGYNGVATTFASATIVAKPYRVVISCFGDWPGHPLNSSQGLSDAVETELEKQIRTYNASNPASGNINATVTFADLDVVWGSPIKAINAQTANGTKPVDFWLALGEDDDLHQGQIQIEEEGTDYRSKEQVDNNGDRGYGVGPLEAQDLPTNNPAIDAFEVGGNARYSADAGDYLCNEMAFDLYQRMGPGQPVKAGVFVHVPEDASGLAEGLAQRVLDALIAERANSGGN